MVLGEGDPTTERAGLRRSDAGLAGHGLGAQFSASYKANPQNTAGLNTEVSPLTATTLDTYRARVEYYQRPGRQRERPRDTGWP
jgi:hypothetical protein